MCGCVRACVLVLSVCDALSVPQAAPPKPVTAMKREPELKVSRERTTLAKLSRTTISIFTTPVNTIMVIMVMLACGCASLVFLVSKPAGERT